MTGAGPPVADLHVHTTASDGSLTLAEIPPIAASVGLVAVAVTDHDRINANFSQPVEEREGVTLVRGIELKVKPENSESIDLLGYALRETVDLRQLVDGLQDNRVNRGRAIIENVEDCLGIDLDIPIREGIGRPHIARAVADHPETEYTYQGVFDELIGDNGPCFVSREIPSLADGMAILGDACPVVSVAHPMRYDDVSAALAIAKAVGAVERWYPYGRPVDLSPVDELIRDADLLATGGSDAHDERLGTAGPPANWFARFADACGLESARTQD